MRDVSWWRVLVAFLATMAVLYTMAFILGSAGGSSIAWIVVFTIVANGLWWGILLLPSKAGSGVVKAK